jgi:hypothetical protein
MLQVELDIFSGRPNPRWTLTPREERELIERVKADPSLMVPVTTPVGGLGYRGYIIERVKEGSGEAGSKERPLPSQFRIGGGHDKDAATSLWLLDTSEKEDTEVDDYLREVAAGTIRQPEPVLATGVPQAIEKGALTACSSNFLTSSTDFSFWNAGQYINKNNCYNFAANHRTNTFAQPGKISGYTLPYPPTCANTRTGVELDGWFNSCQAADNLTICLVIWPGYDFHFYRKCQSNIWCHKPGRTAARNYDNSGNIITNPETCNRGGYTTFCEYWYADNDLILVS